MHKHLEPSRAQSRHHYRLALLITSNFKKVLFAPPSFSLPVSPDDWGKLKNYSSVPGAYFPTEEAHFFYVDSGSGWALK